MLILIARLFVYLVHGQSASVVFKVSMGPLFFEWFPGGGFM